uniref:Protein pxr1-like n=1 Tax=Heterorhabditis bacteriophora TaxID=37862 RepID=A0A1I7WS20_HETBA
MEVDESLPNIKEDVSHFFCFYVRPAPGSFEAALVAAAALPKKKENAPPKKVKEEYSDDDDIPWAQRMAKDQKNGKNNEKKKDKKRRADSYSEDEYKPEVSDDDIPCSKRVKRESSPFFSGKTGTKVDNNLDEEINAKIKKDKRRKKESEETIGSDSDYCGEPKKVKREKESKKRESSTSKKLKKEPKKEVSSPQKKKKREEEEDVWELGFIVWMIKNKLYNIIYIYIYGFSIYNSKCLKLKNLNVFSIVKIYKRN